MPRCSGLSTRLQGDEPRTAGGRIHRRQLRLSANPAVKIRIPTPPLETHVSKSPDRGVIGRANVARRWPLRVLGPVLARSCDEGLYVALSVIDSCATHLGRRFIGRPSASPRPILVQNSHQSRSLAPPGLSGVASANRSQPFRTFDRDRADHSRLTSVHTFGPLPPVQSTTSPTGSWHFKSQDGKMELVASDWSPCEPRVSNRRLFKTRELRSIDTSIASALASPVAILGRDSHRRRQNDLGARHAIAGQESGPKSPWDLRSTSRCVSGAGEQYEKALAG